MRLIFTFLIIFALVFIKTYFLLDPDFGWHLKLGELILGSGIPVSDPFSYTMPSFSFIDHEWLTNVLIYFFYQNIGWVFLSLAFSLLLCLSILIPIKFKINLLSALPITLTLLTLLLFLGIRPQIITLFFYSILITTLLDKRIYEKFRYFIPLLVLLWVNLHGGFALGIITYGLFVVVRSIENRKVDVKDIVILMMCFVFSFINPYKIRIWEEIINQSSDQSLRWTISEWMPSLFTFYPALWIYVAISSVLVFIQRKFLTTFEKLLFVVLLVAGLSSIRHMALWAIVALPITYKNLFTFQKKISKIKYGKKRFHKACAFLIMLTIVVSITHVLIKWDNLFTYSEKGFYPYNATLFLRENPRSGQLLSSYGWGGYLIWKLPDKKVFIDGRMPSWRNEYAPIGESKNAFKDYNELMIGIADFEKVTKKYSIDTILLPSRKVDKKNFIKNIDKALSRLINKEELKAGIYTNLEKNGWEIVYQDDISIIYRKNYKLDLKF